VAAARADAADPATATDGLAALGLARCVGRWQSGGSAGVVAAGAVLL